MEAKVYAGQGVNWCVSTLRFQSRYGPWHCLHLQRQRAIFFANSEGVQAMKNLKRILFLLPAVALLLSSACSSQDVTLVHPHNGATVQCSGSGFGLGATWVKGYVDDCIRRNEIRGYVPLDKLTPQQRAALEKRGLLP
jgi:hypothetical protein